MMTKSITISEYISSVWRVILTSSLSLSIVFLILFLLLQSPLLVGIFRLCSFIFFAISVLSVLQMRGKTQKIDLELYPEELKINYFISTRKNQEEIFKVNEIEQIKQSPAPPIWNVIPRKNSTKLLISFIDTSTTLPFLRFKGRDLYVTSSDAQKVVEFFEQHIQSS